MGATLLNGFILGWSVAWPPGPVNGEIIRRSVLPSARGGGFWPAFSIGLGACSGDFLWALSVAAGAGALMNTPRVRTILGCISLALLLFLAFTFLRNAWKTAREPNTSTATEDLDEPSAITTRRRTSRGYLLGFTLAITSPWNIGFWLAVIGSQQNAVLGRTFAGSLLLAGSVVLGAGSWGLVLCLAVRQGARLFARSAWQIATQLLTAAVMLYFAGKVIHQLAV